jgi:hypothetical protein
VQHLIPQQRKEAGEVPGFHSGDIPMRKLFTTAAILAVLAPLSAYADDQKTFQHQRDTYVYETETRDGSTIITGRRHGGERFRLVHKNGRVTGNVGGTPVAFRAPAQATAVTVMAAN